MAEPTQVLWAQDQYVLTYSFDNGSTWVTVDLSDLPGSPVLINGIAGPSNDFKVYVAVESNGIYSYDGYSWTQEHAIYISTWYYSYHAVKIWCADDDSFAIAAGTGGSNDVISTRDGPPGTAWTDYNYGIWLRAFDVSGDGNDIFGISYVNSYTWKLHKRASNGTWSEVASNTGGYGTYAWAIQVVSDTEVWIAGQRDDGGGTEYDTIWLWNGSALSVAFENETTQDGITALWVSKDGYEGWAASNDSTDGYDTEYFQYNGSAWSSHSRRSNSPADYPMDITQREGIPSTAKTIFSMGGYTEYSGSSWGTTPTDPHSGSGYGLFIKYIEIIGIPPRLQNRDPAPDSIGNPRDTNVTLEIVDSSGVDGATVEIAIEGSLAWSGDTEQPGFSVVKTPMSDGYRYVINPDSDFSGGQTIDVDVDAYDLAPSPNFLSTSYSFKIAEGPYLDNQDPAPGETGVSPRSTIIFDIKDDGYGIDGYSVNVLINDQLAWNHDSIQSGFSGTRSIIADGYHLEISQNTPDIGNISVGVNAKNNSGYMPLVAEYLLNESSPIDTSGNDNHGINYGFTTGVTGVYGSAYRSTSITQYIDVSSVIPDISLDEGSIEFWLKVSNISYINGYSDLFWIWDNPTWFSYIGIYFDSGNITMYRGADSVDAGIIDFPHPHIDTDWHLYRMEWSVSGDYIKGYIDGTQIDDTKNGVLASTTTPNTAWIGWEDNSPLADWDSIRIGDRLSYEFTTAPTFVSISIEEGMRGERSVFNNYNFLSPYTNSYINFDNSDGYDGYNFVIIKDSDFGLGNIAIDVSVDGYEDPINITPAPGSYDVPRDTEIRFRLRKL